MILNREAILQSSDLKTETVSVPEWGGEVLVKGMSGTERDAFEAGNILRKDKNGKPGFELNAVNIRARLCSLCIVDETGKRLFTDTDVEALGRKNAAALHRVFEVAQRLSGLTKADVEELEKN